VKGNDEMATYYPRGVGEEEILLKNQIYNHAADPLWRLAVYEPVHDGWEFTNMGGRQVLDFIGMQAGLDSGKEVLESCTQ
jgi:sarcosine/dimethylglycine N-methyltransferase